MKLLVWFLAAAWSVPAMAQTTDPLVDIVASDLASDVASLVTFLTSYIGSQQRTATQNNVPAAATSDLAASIARASSILSSISASSASAALNSATAAIASSTSASAASRLSSAVSSVSASAVNSRLSSAASAVSSASSRLSSAESSAAAAAATAGAAQDGNGGGGGTNHRNLAIGLGVGLGLLALGLLLLVLLLCCRRRRRRNKVHNGRTVGSDSSLEGVGMGEKRHRGGFAPFRKSNSHHRDTKSPLVNDTNRHSNVPPAYGNDGHALGTTGPGHHTTPLVHNNERGLAPGTTTHSGPLGHHNQPGVLPGTTTHSGPLSHGTDRGLAPGTTTHSGPLTHGTGHGLHPGANTTSGHGNGALLAAGAGGAAAGAAAARHNRRDSPNHRGSPSYDNVHHGNHPPPRSPHRNSLDASDRRRRSASLGREDPLNPSHLTHDPMPNNASNYGPGGVGVIPTGSHDRHSHGPLSADRGLHRTSPPVGGVHNGNDADLDHLRRTGTLTGPGHHTHTGSGLAPNGLMSSAHEGVTVPPTTTSGNHGLSRAMDSRPQDGNRFYDGVNNQPALHGNTGPTRGINDPYPYDNTNTARGVNDQYPYDNNRNSRGLVDQYPRDSTTNNNGGILGGITGRSPHHDNNTNLGSGVNNQPFRGDNNYGNLNSQPPRYENRGVDNPLSSNPTTTQITHPTSSRPLTTHPNDEVLSHYEAPTVTTTTMHRMSPTRKQLNSSPPSQQQQQRTEMPGSWNYGRERGSGVGTAY